MPFSKDLKPIILRLYEATKEDRVNWCGQHREISVIFPRSSVRMWKYTDDEEEEGITIALIDQGGNQVASNSFPASDADYPLVAELYDLASRRSRGVDEVLKEIVSELAKQGPIGRIKRDAGRVHDPIGDDIPF